MSMLDVDDLILGSFGGCGRWWSILGWRGGIWGVWRVFRDTRDDRKLGERASGRGCQWRRAVPGIAAPFMPCEVYAIGRPYSDAPNGTFSRALTLW